MQFLQALNQKGIAITASLLTLTLLTVSISPPLANVFSIASFLAAILFSTTRERLCQWLSTPLAKAVGAWILLLVLYTIFSQAPAKQAWLDLWTWRKVLLLPIALVVFSGNTALQKKALWVAILFYATVAVLSFITLFFPDHYFFPKFRAGILMRNHVTQAMVMSLSGALVFAYLCYYRTEMSTRAKQWAVLLLLLFSANIFVATTGRSGYLAFFVMIGIIWLMYTLRMHWMAKLSGFVVLGLLAIAVLLFAGNVSERMGLALTEASQGWEQEQNTSVGLRVSFAKKTIDLIPQYWLRGAGTGGFEQAYRANLISGNEMTTSDPHNQYLKILIEQGVLGILFFLYVVYALVRAPAANPFFKTVAMSFLGAWLLTSLFNSHFWTFNEGVLIWLLLGITLAPQQLGTKKPSV